MQSRPTPNAGDQAQERHLPEHLARIAHAAIVEAQGFSRYGDGQFARVNDRHRGVSSRKPFLRRHEEPARP
jgi:hypothetical protein